MTDFTALEHIFREAAACGRDFLLEPEGYAFMHHLGIPVPGHTVIGPKAAVTPAHLEAVPSEKAVLKVVSPSILHKTDVGGVAVAANTVEAVSAARDAMHAALCRQFPESAIEGYLLCEFVPYSKELGTEALIGCRLSNDFGPVVTYGYGGVETEFLARVLRDGQSVAIFSPFDTGGEELGAVVDGANVSQKLLGRIRNQKPLAKREDIVALLEAFSAVASHFSPLTPSSPFQLLEWEVNPFVASGGRLVALDFLLKFAPNCPAPAPKPVDKIRSLLLPSSIAVMGASEKGMNPGRIILRNILREGFPVADLYCVKPGLESLDGARCVPDVASLPKAVDLLVLAVDAAQVPGILEQVIDHQRAESVIVIPGGIGEKEGTRELVVRAKAKLAESRATAWRGPVINGGNCLGIRSLAGKYDTLFIPEYKLALPHGEASPMALISQSGAFLVSKTNKLGAVNPKVSISVGNQMDLSVADYLEYLKGDPDIRFFALYVEGFTPGDGLRIARLVRELDREGRPVLFYKAGRTEEGKKASAGHTASIAGDWPTCEQIMARAGAVVTSSVEDFEALVKMFTFLKDKRPKGLRLGAVSNAGYECVAIADNLAGLTLPELAPATDARLRAIFEKVRIASIVDVHNPIDLTPMAGDEAYDEVSRAVLDDPNVDCGVIGVVPLTPALNTLEAAEGHKEDLTRTESIVNRLIRLKAEHPKPFIVAVDGGRLYDAMSYRLEDAGIPVFRTVERGLKLFSVYLKKSIR
jgi:acyl-CoA synthetase (NDP forming)